MKIAEQQYKLKNQLNKSYQQNYKIGNSVMILKHIYMNISAITILIILFAFSAHSKTTRKKIPVYELATQSQTAYVSRFGFSTTGGQIIVKLNKYGEEFPQLTNLKLGLLMDQDFYSHKNAQTCEQKQQFYKQTFKLKFFSPTQGMSSIPISKNDEEHLYFFYLYSCDFVDADADNQSTLGIDLIMTNNGLGMSEYGGTFWPYLIMASLCVGLASRYYKEVIEFIKMNKNLSSVLMCIGYMIGSMAIISKFLNSAYNLMDGDESQFFSALYNTLKVFQQVTMATVLVSIAWGWLLNHQENKKYYYVIVGGVTLMNFLSEIISLLNKEQVTNQNLYQGAIGKFSLLLRITICLVFVSGCLYVSLQTIPKRQKFINTYAEIGAVYLLTNLISLLCSSIFAHAYNHGQTIPTLQDILRFSCIVYLCYLFAYPKQVSYEQIGFGFQFDDENSSCIQREDFFLESKNQPASVGSIMEPPPLINLQQPPIHPIQKQNDEPVLQQHQNIQYEVSHTKFDSDQNENEQKKFISHQNRKSGLESIEKKHENQIQEGKQKRITVGNTGALAKTKNKIKSKKNKAEHPIIIQPTITEPAEKLEQIQPPKQQRIAQKIETVQQTTQETQQTIVKEIVKQEQENKIAESQKEEIQDNQV